eukprot:8154316-Pyramimonas_sp.AAC.1
MRLRAQRRADLHDQRQRVVQRHMSIGVIPTSYSSKNTATWSKLVCRKTKSTLAGVDIVVDTLCCVG